MFEITVVAGKVAGIVAFTAFVPYIISIFRKETKPNRATWFIWTIVNFMATASYYSSGASHTIWIPIIYATMPLFVFILSLKYGVGGYTKFDLACLIISGISAILWLASGVPLTALIINLFIDLIGSLPTVKKIYHDPKSEDRSAWVLATVANLINLFAVEKWTFTIAIYPMYMFVVGLSTTSFIFIRRNQKLKNK